MYRYYASLDLIATVTALFRFHFTCRIIEVPVFSSSRIRLPVGAYFYRIIILTSEKNVSWIFFASVFRQGNRLITRRLVTRADLLPDSHCISHGFSPCYAKRRAETKGNALMG